MDRRRKKRRRNKSYRETVEYLKNRENEVNIGGRRRMKNAQDPLTTTSSRKLKRTRNRPENFHEERRLRRKNRKRGRTRNRSSFSRRVEVPQRDEPIVLFIGNISNATVDDTRKEVENKFQNFTLAQATDENGPSNIPGDSLESIKTAVSNSTTASLQPKDPRIPEPPQPTSRYQKFLGNKVAGKVEREFSRHVEREISKIESSPYSEFRIRNKTARKLGLLHPLEAETRSRSSEFPSFDERYLKPEDYGKTPFDPERMLGYSRTDEDLPILDLENEVLQRTLKDYNAYMSSSLMNRMEMSQDSSDNETDESLFDDRINDRTGTNEAAISRESEPMDYPTTVADDENLTGDLSCINGTFIPAPVIGHALIKYVK